MADLRRGFGIIEVLVALAILGIAAVGFSNMLNNTLKGKAHVEESLDKVDLQGIVQMIIANPEACSKAFVSSATGGAASFNVATTPQSNFDTLKLGSSIIAQRGQVIENRPNLRATDLQIVQVPLSPVISTVGGVTDYFVSLTLGIAKVNAAKSIGPSDFLNIETKFKIRVNDATKLIIGCSNSGYGCKMQRSDVPTGGDFLMYCPANFPRLSSCRTVDNSAPVGSLMQMSASTNINCQNGGSCPAVAASGVGFARGGLGTDVQYEETVQKSATDDTEGCWVYDSGHAHTQYRVETVCCTK